MVLKQLLKKIVEHKDLTENESSLAIRSIFRGEEDDASIAAFLAALAVKGESSSELSGAARVLREDMLRIQSPGQFTVDTCGTGGDGQNTFNISTCSAFVVAGCGAVVAKHGNRSLSSKCGSADVLEALGVRLDIPVEAVEEALFEINIGFLFAPNFHAAMRYAAPARKTLGIRTLFNAIGPIANPAGTLCQLIGVYKAELTESLAKALLNLGTRKAFVVHGHDGLDEISISAPSRISEISDGTIKTYDLYPEIYFEEEADPEELKGGDAEENAEILKKVLSGEKGAKRNIVLINSAAALVACEKAENIEEGIKLATESIDSGAALDKLNQLIVFSREAANG